MFKLFILALALFQMTHAAQELPCGQNSLESLPVQHQGRVKPYLVLANETIKHLTGKTKVNNLKAPEVFCTLSFSYLLATSLELKAQIGHEKIRKLIPVNPENEIAYSELAGHIQTLRAEYMSQKLNNSYKKALNKLIVKNQYYQAMTEGSLWTIPVERGGEFIWHGLKDIFTETTATDIGQKLERYQTNYIQSQGDGDLIELTYVKSHIFSIALLLALIAVFVVVLTQRLHWAYIATAIVIITEITGLVFRVLISGRAPITNMYETVMFSGFGALIIALIISIVKRDKIYLLAGLGYNTLCLFMMKFSGGMLDESISPLVPVLRDNFWLSTHVTTIILSYAALALSWMLANITLYKTRFSSITKSEQLYYENLIYTCIKVGIILLAAGIILGGVWADYSWGRFWGWDPKETWSLIVLLFYMAILHGKNTPWINHQRFIALSALGFLTVMMAWFGVNYILAAGLHSYGFSEGGAIFLGIFFMTQIVFVIICNIKKSIKINENP